MAEFVSQQDGKERDRERQAAEQCRRMLIQELKSSNEFVNGDRLVVGKGHRELRACNEAGAQRQHEQQSCQCQAFARRPRRSDGVIVAYGRNGAPIYVDGKWMSGAFWESSSHE